MEYLAFISHGSAISVVYVGLALQALIALAIVSHNRSSRKTIERIARDVRNLNRRIESLTAPKRTHFVREFDSLMSSLSKKLPAQIGTAVSDAVVDLEKSILTRLAELESAHSFGESRGQLEEIIIRMEALEESLVLVSTDAVEQSLQSAKASVLEGECFSDLTKAA